MKIISLALAVVFLSACQSPENDQSTTQNVASKQQPTEPQENVANEAASDLVQDGKSGSLNFTLNNLSGEQVQAADYRGQWLILNYWATWCAPCRDEIPELVRFQNEHDNVQILGIAYEDAPVEKLQNFAADFNVNYPLLTMDIYDPPAFAAEGGLGLPTTIVYTPEGMRHKKHMGPIDYKGLQALIE